MPQFRGGAQGGTIPNAPVKKSLFWVIIGSLAFLFLLLTALHATYYRITGKSLQSGAQTEDSRAHSSSSRAPEKIKVTFTTDGYEIPVPPRQWLYFNLKQGGIKWDVKVNRQGDWQKMLPIDDPNYKDPDFGNHGEYINFRVRPGQTAQTCPLVYWFVPM